MPVTTHAYLSPSSAHRWLICPPIVQFEAAVPGDGGSSFAAEGTAAHALAEAYLTKRFKLGKAAPMIKEAKASSFYDTEMEESVSYYCDLVEECANAYDDPIIELESKLDMGKWAPDVRGTSDVVIIADGVVEIIDLKYGKGVPVYADNNPQLMLYALGAYDKYSILYEFDKIKMTIIQPRLDNLSTFEIETAELLYWADNYVAPRAVQAYEGTGEWTITDDVVKFSKIRAQLRPRAEKNFKLVDKYDSKEAATLSDEEIAEILDRAPEIKKWLDHVESYALSQALSGKANYPGFKVVEGRSIRKISDPQAVMLTLDMEGYTEDQYTKPKELVALGALEKLVGKKELTALIGDYIVKPEGKPTLVPESDKRPPLRDANSDFADIEVVEDE